MFGIIPHKLKKKAQIISTNLRFLHFTADVVLAVPAAIEMNPYKSVRRTPSFYAKIWQKCCQQGHSGVTVLSN